MDIALVSTRCPLSMAEGMQSAYVAALSAALAQHGENVTVYARQEQPSSARSVTTVDDYRVVSVPAGPAEPLTEDELLPHISQFAQFLDATWQRRRPEVVHAVSWMSGAAALLAARHNHVPTVQTFRGFGAGTPGGGRVRLEAALAKNADWVAASNSDEMSDLIRLGRARARISLLPNGVDAEAFNPVGDHVDRAARPRILAVGPFLPDSGFEVVIRALPAIGYVDLVVLGAGSGVESELVRLRRLAVELSVADRVEFHQAVSHNDLPSWYRSADVVVCAAPKEATGTTALQAMACGVPVVASAVGAHLDIVVDDVTGRLVPTEHPEQFAHAIDHVLHEPFLARGYGGCGRDRAYSRYAWDQIAADTTRMYEQAQAR